jgi:hypothetical protein
VLLAIAFASLRSISRHPAEEEGARERPGVKAAASTCVGRVENRKKREKKLAYLLFCLGRFNTPLTMLAPTLHPRFCTLDSASKQ